MTLIKTSLLNGIAVTIRMLTLLAINKILAIYTGPAGYAALGQFQNAIQMITTFAGGAINTGVTKYTAEYHGDEEKQYRVWQTAGTVALFTSLATSTGIALFNQELAVWFLKSASYGDVFLWFASTLVLFSCNALLLAILNGKKEIGRYVLANISGSMLSFVVTAIMASQFGLHGALIALTIYQSIAFLVTLLLSYKAPWFKLRNLFGDVDKKTALNLSKYAAMAITSAVCVPVSQMIVRNHLGETLSWQAAGYWEAISRLSSAYLMLVTTTLSVYYLPKLSELEEADEIKDEIFAGYKTILPVVALCGGNIFLFRDLIIGFLFTREFIPMRELFAWQMIGDTLKIGSWFLAYLMVGKAMYKLFIATDIIFSASFVLLTWLFTKKLGLQGVVVAYAINYLIYWIVMACLVRNKLEI